MCNPPDLLDSAVFVVFLAALDVTVEVITVFSHFHSLSLSLLLSPSPSFHLSLSLSLSFCPISLPGRSAFFEECSAAGAVCHDVMNCRCAVSTAWRRH